MSISNVLQTELMELVMQNIYPELFKDNFKLEQFSSEEELLEKYQKRCRIARRGANSDIHKGLSEGKPVIIEGFCVDPELYLKPLDSEGKKVDEEKLREIESLLKDREASKISKDNIMKINMSDHHKDKFLINTEYPIEGFPVRSIVL